MSSVLFQMLLGALLLVGVVVAFDVYTSRQEQARRKARAEELTKSLDEAVAEFTKNIEEAKKASSRDDLREDTISSITDEILGKWSAKRPNPGSLNELVLGQQERIPLGEVEQFFHQGSYQAFGNPPRHDWKPVFAKMSRFSNWANINDLEVFDHKDHAYIGLNIHGRIIIIGEVEDKDVIRAAQASM